MGVDILIEGVSVIAGENANGRYWVDLSSVDVQQDIAVQQTTAAFRLYIRGTYQGNGQWAWPIAAPQTEQEVIFLNSDGTREFGGILQEPQETEVEPDTMVYSCQCSDFTQWFDRRLVNQTYAANTTVQALVENVVSQYVNTAGNSRTFTTSGVQTNPSMPLPILQFVYQPPSQVMGQITQMLGWGWYIDFYRDVHLYSTTYLPSPLPGNVLNADDLWNDPALASRNLANWVDLSIGVDGSQLKNVVYITGIYVAQDQLYTQPFTGDGTTTVFTLGYQPPNDVSNITVSVDGTQYQIALDQVDSVPGGPCLAQTAYVNFSAQTVRFCTAPANGATIQVTFYPMTQTVVGEQDAASQQYLAGISGTDGIFEYNDMDPSLSAELPTLAQERAAISLNKYAYPIVTLTFTSYLSGWFVGQYFTFQSQRRYQGQYNGQNFFVISVQKSIVQVAADGPWLFKYTINAANIPYEL